MKTKVLFGMFLVMSTLNWSCIDVVLVNSEKEMETLETNLITEEVNLKSVSLGKQFSLQLKNGESVGIMSLSNNANTLTVKFAENSNYNIKEIQLWIGTDPGEVPSNIKNKPIPGKFPYKLSGKNEYQFEIAEEEIAPEYNLGEGSNLYLFVHANAINKNTGTEESAWSEGEYLTNNLQSAISYSTYTPAGGGGCFPHTAVAGTEISNAYYVYANTSVEQYIIADSDEIIGIIAHNNGTIRFSFYQDWMLEDSEGNIEIAGLNSLHKHSTVINDFMVKRELGDFIIDVPTFNYYRVNLKVQYCTTGN